MSENQEARIRLGHEMRRIRKEAGLVLREVDKSNSGDLSSMERGRKTVPVSVIATYQALCKQRHEVQNLHALWLDARRKSEASDKRAQPQLPSEPPQCMDDVEIGQSRYAGAFYEIESQDRVVILNRNCAVEVARTRVRIRTTYPGVSLYAASSTYLADPRPGVLTPEASAHCKLDGFRHNMAGATESYFKLDRELVPNDAEPYEFYYLERVKTKKRVVPPIAFYRTRGMKHVSLAIQLDAVAPALLPEPIWWFAVEAKKDVNLDPPLGNYLKIDSDGYCRMEFDQRILGSLPVGGCFGIHWPQK